MLLDGGVPEIGQNIGERTAYLPVRVLCHLEKYLLVIVFPHFCCFYFRSDCGLESAIGVISVESSSAFCGWNQCSHGSCMLEGLNVQSLWVAGKLIALSWMLSVFFSVDATVIHRALIGFLWTSGYQQVSHSWQERQSLKYSCSHSIYVTDSTEPLLWRINTLFMLMILDNDNAIECHV